MPADQEPTPPPQDVDEPQAKRKTKPEKKMTKALRYMYSAMAPNEQLELASLWRHLMFPVNVFCGAER